MQVKFSKINISMVLSILVVIVSWKIQIKRGYSFFQNLSERNKFVSRYRVDTDIIYGKKLLCFNEDHK